MSDATLLPELIRREGRTFLQYIREAYPWAHTGADTDHRTRLLALADAESAEIARLGRLLQRRHISLPFLGAFPTAFTSSNFLAIAFLLPRLAAAQRQDIAELEPKVRAITDPELRTQFEAYVELKRSHLPQTGGRRQPRPGGVVDWSHRSNLLGRSIRRNGFVFDETESCTCYRNCTRLRPRNSTASSQSQMSNRSSTCFLARR